jgi:fucose permease
MYKKTQVFAAACIGLFLFGMILISLGSILPSLKEKFIADSLNTGILASILPIGILAGSLIFGPIVDRYGYKLLLIVSILISAIAMEGLAFSGSLPLLAVCIFSAGFGGGIINGGTNALVADISEENKGANLSLLGVFFGIGAFGLPFLSGALSKNFDYSSIISAVGLFMLFPVIYFLLIRFPSPKLAQGFPLKEGVKLLKEPALLLTAFFLFFQSGAESLINNWTTTFLHDKIKMPGEDALYALSFSLAGLTIARLLLGVLLKKISSFVVLMVSLLLVAASSFVLMYTRSYNTVFAALITIGAGLAAGFPVILGYIGQLYTSLSGTAFSICLVIALAGNTFLNYLIGIIARKYTIDHLPLLVISCIVCMIILLVLIKQKIKTKVKL